MSKLAGVSGAAILVTVVGATLAYSGLKGKSIAQTVQLLIQGKNPSAAVQATAIDYTPGTVPAGADPSMVNPGTVPGTTLPSIPGVTAQGGTPATNKAIAKLLAAPYGWSTGANWTALDQLWTQESSWSNIAENPSGAYGIAQALPASKYPAAGQKPISSASAQIAWGLNYIKATYGNPVNAWSHEVAMSWY